jgi:hypothetical protein
MLVCLQAFDLSGLLFLIKPFRPASALRKPDCSFVESTLNSFSFSSCCFMVLVLVASLKLAFKASTFPRTATRCRPTGRPPSPLPRTTRSNNHFALPQPAWQLRRPL